MAFLPGGQDPDRCQGGRRLRPLRPLKDFQRLGLKPDRLRQVFLPFRDVGQPTERFGERRMGLALRLALNLQGLMEEGRSPIQFIPVKEHQGKIFEADGVVRVRFPPALARDLQGLPRAQFDFHRVPFEPEQLQCRGQRGSKGLRRAAVDPLERVDGVENQRFGGGKISLVEQNFSVPPQTGRVLRVFGSQALLAERQCLPQAAFGAVQVAKIGSITPKRVQVLGVGPTPWPERLAKETDGPGNMPLSLRVLPGVVQFHSLRIFRLGLSQPLPLLRRQ